MTALGVQSAAGTLKAKGASLPGPGPDELTAVLGYLKPKDIEQIEQPYQVARAAHSGQYRQSGAPYNTHPLAVAKILAEWHLDAQALIAALLHDVVEDTPTTKTEIAKRFGKAVAELVDGVSKIDRIEFATLQHAQAENFRKMLLAMARDVRVILIKLADRLHNMRTLEAVPPEKQERIARETLDIYAPIANRLGLISLYYELEDLGFHYLHPTRFKVLDKALKKARGNRRDAVGKIQDAIQNRLREFKVEAQVTGREKHISSIYKKMQEKNISFSEVFASTASASSFPTCRPAISRWARCTRSTSRFPASSRTTSRSRRRTATSRCTPRSSGPSACRSRSRSARPRCTRWPRRAWPPTGCTRAWRATPRTWSSRPTSGCSRSSRSRANRATRSSSSSTSRWTSSPTRSTCFLPRARSSRSPRAPPRSISPTRSTPTSATTASPPRSTASRCRSARSSGTG